MSPSAQLTITTDDLAAIIQHQLTIAEHHGAAALAPLMVWRAPGVGKSSVIRNLCDRHNIGFIDIRLSQREPCMCLGPTHNSRRL